MQEDSENNEMRVNDMWRFMSSQSDKESQRYMGKEQLIELNASKQRCKKFIQEIKYHAHTGLRQDILTYCDQQKKLEKFLESQIKPENIIKKIDIRIDKMMKNKRIKRNWGDEDLYILIWIISKYCDYKNLENLEKDIALQDWNFIASIIPGVTAESCMFKWLSIKKITLATHNWTKMESELLATIVKQKLSENQAPRQIKNWKEISQNLYKYNTDSKKIYRNAKQCREHWTCYLSPYLKKGPWQLYEDVKLLKLIKQNKGLKKWSQIARYFQGRTENALKNRYTLIIDKQKKNSKNKGKLQLDLINEYLQKCYVDQFTTNLKIQQDSMQESSEIINQPESLENHYNNTYNTLKRQQDVKPQIVVQSEVMTPITPRVVHMISFSDLANRNMDFLKNIQPGVIQPSGFFKKIENNVIKRMNSFSYSEDFDQFIPATPIKKQQNYNQPFSLMKVQSMIEFSTPKKQAVYNPEDNDKKSQKSQKLLKELYEQESQEYNQLRLKQDFQEFQSSV